MLALNRRGVRDCCRCIDDDLRRRHHGRRQADGRCLDVSVTTSRSMLQLVNGMFEVHIAAWRTLHWRIGRCQKWCNRRNAIQVCCRGVSVLLDVAMFVQQAVLRHVFCVAVSVLRCTRMQLRCTMMQHIPRCSVSHGVTARRVASCAARPLRGGRTASPASLCSSCCPRMSMLKRPSPMQTSGMPSRRG